MAPELPRLSRFHVADLFGEFEHTIDLRLEERITAVIAPNGSGKTVCLRLINALFRRHWAVFASTQFTYVDFLFSNGAGIEVRKSEGPEGEDEGLGLTVTVTLPRGEMETWSPKISDEQRPRISQLERYLPFLTRIGPAKWTHDNTGQQFTTQEVLHQYGDALPLSLRRGLFPNEPIQLKALIEAIDCHLIETQRLLILNDEPSRYERRLISTLAISKKAQVLKDIVSAELTNYATLSQSLDRSFPRRVIGRSSIATQEDLRKSIAEIDEQRKQLTTAGILDHEGDDQMSLPEGAIDEAVARVLTIYATDTKQKLDSLSTLLHRIGAFKSLIEQRFNPKTVEVSKADGFRIKNRIGQYVPLDRLSSGEQHQLVLYFELLFELKPNALILIDEPELSLHVAWQKKFIGDLQTIIGLNKFDVVLATHSPQLIGRWENLVVDLGDVDDDEID